MDEKNNSDKLPVVQKNKSLSVKAKRFLIMNSDNMKRVGKILGFSATALIGIGGGLLTSVPPLTIAGVGVFLGSGIRAIQNARFKIEPSLLFASRKDGDKLKIEQDFRLGIASKMRSFDRIEKGQMMLLQSLVGLSRYKENLKGKDFIKNDDESKVYNQVFSTVTHGINLKTLMALEKLDYIKIDSINEKFEPGFFSRVLGKKEAVTKDSLLIAEKLAFLEFNEIGKIASLKWNGKKDELDKHKQKLKEVNFRLTDKPIDFEELYQEVNNLSEVSDKEKKAALLRIGIIFGKKGILANKNIDITKDFFGRDIIKYDAKESFTDRIDKGDLKESGKEKKKVFSQELRKNVDLEKVEKARKKSLQNRTMR